MLRPLLSPRDPRGPPLLLFFFWRFRFPTFCTWLFRHDFFLRHLWLGDRLIWPSSITCAPAPDRCVGRNRQRNQATTNRPFRFRSRLRRRPEEDEEEEEEEHDDDDDEEIWQRLVRHNRWLVSIIKSSRAVQKTTTSRNERKETATEATTGELATNFRRCLSCQCQVFFPVPYGRS